MRGVNKVMLIGNLGKDPEVTYLEGHIGVAKFPMATTETYKDKSGKLISETEWHNIVLWRGLAELSEKYLHKGSLIYVEGRLHNRSWEDRNGNKKFATEIIADNMIMLDKKPDFSHTPFPHETAANEKDLNDSSDDVTAPDEDPSGKLPF